VGLGIGELSSTPSAVPVIKEIIHALEAGPVDADARAARQAATGAEVRGIAARRLRQSGLLDHADLGSWLVPIVEAAEREA
jgi:phosphoenolpyruvate-protein kinase (PTS system EI component)